MVTFSTDLISVIIPTYGRSEYLLRAVNSVLKQSYSNIEVIVVDDNGTNTVNQITTYENLRSLLLQDNRLKYIPHQINLNGAAARNTGINASKGEFICFLDDDDEFEKDKIDKQYHKLIKSNSKACYCGHLRIKNDTIISSYNPDYEGDLLFPLLMHKIDACTGSTLMIKRDLLEKVKGFDVSFKRHQDYEFIARVAYHTEISVIPESLVKIHMHDGSYSQRNYSDIIATRKLYNMKMKQYYNKLNAEQIRIINYNNNIIFAKIALKHKKIKDFINYAINSKSIKLFLDLGKATFNYLSKK